MATQTTTLKCEHEWLPETQYRIRRCKHCGVHHFDDALKRLRWRAHMHMGDLSGNPQPPGPTCYGMYETCGEHHMHDATCGGRRLICGRPEDPDAFAIVEWIDAHMEKRP